MRIAFSRYKFNLYILNLLTFLVLLRATNMGFAYPNAEFLLALITYAPQKIMQFFAIVVLGVFILLNFKRSMFYLLPNKLVSILLIVILISILFSPDLSSTLRYFISVLVIALPIFLHYKFLGANSLFRLLRLFFIFVVVANLLYVLAFPQYGIMSANHAGAWRGMFVHKNGFGSFIALITVFLFVDSFATKSSLITKAIFIASILMVFLSHSATAIVASAFCFSTFFFLLFLAQFKQKTNRLLLLLAYFFIFLVIYWVIASNLDTILMLLGKDPTLTGRTELWDVLLRLSIDRPLFGYGVGYFSRSEVMAQFAVDFGWEAKSTHSSYVELILGIGYVGTYVFMAIISKLLLSAIMARSGNEYERKVNAAVLASIFGILVVSASASGILLGNSISWALLVVLLCLLDSQVGRQSSVSRTVH